MPSAIHFGENIIVEQKYSLLELSQIPANGFVAEPLELLQARIFSYNPTRICIMKEWFDVIPLHMLVRTKAIDGYYAHPFLNER